MSHNPLYQSLRRDLLRAKGNSRSETSCSASGISVPGVTRMRLSRRGFIRTVAGAGVGAAAFLAGCRHAGRDRRSDVSVAVVGAGIAGLNAAWQLRKHGVDATVYEASPRTGGRMITRGDVVADGTYADLGGELVNSWHEDMIALAGEFDVPLIDNFEEMPAPLLRNAYVVDGRAYTSEEVADAFRPYAGLVAADYRRITEDYETHAPRFDRMSVEEYLKDRLGMNGWLYRLFEGVYTSEFGLECAEQTALYFIWMLPAVDNGAVDLLGDSDEQYRIRGGAQRLTDAMAARLGDGSVRPDHRLEAIHPRGRRIELVFDGTTVVADFAVITVPFSVLREQVEISFPLPPDLRRGIRETAYGVNSKLLAGFTSRPWRDAGYGGSVYASNPVQMAWDHTLGQPSSHGGLTFYLGGDRTGAVAGGSVPDEARAMIEGLSPLVPGLGEAHNGRSRFVNWADRPLSKGSYACWKPGQYTDFIERILYLENGESATEVRAGNLVFAGEHCSDEYQGFMNGGAQSGRLAARSVLRSIGAAAVA